ncbi:hypothetical protein BDDG_05627 [Blastomyces dermatitidis ATCC 18188]|uniref:Zn(2)-C6 fungal-type domain-containing protein n=1 Tax=Ajellomyces dermatitidis (strain ATCC 18188 / CBS 674.68) TaxID=653446 RepID=F2THH0_AJEDA|nr:hypothetical protein BDDG_05627 [Blastomyces dermatitidis ATCC 18188]
MSPAYFETQEDLQFCRQSTRGMSYPVSHSLRGDVQHELGGGYSNRICSTTEPGVNGGGTTTRRRIPVACGRCRRRKIKCSGDIGNGQCTNCRNAGTQSCQFLRVSSFNTHAKPYYGCSWPYPGAGPTSGSYVNGGGYETQASSRTSSVSIHSVTPTFPPYSKPQCTYDQGTQFAPVSRSPFVPAFQINYEGDSQSYSIPSPQYMLPSTDSTGGSSYSSYIGSPRASQVGKIRNEDIYHEQDGHPALGSNYSYMTHTQHPVSVSSDLPSALPLLSAISSSSSVPDRILPNPASSRNGRDNGSTVGAHSAEPSLPSSCGTGPGLNARSSGHLAPDGLSSSNQQSTMKTTPTTIANGADSPSTSKPLIGHTDMGFGYVMSSNSAVATMRPTTTFSGVEPVEGFHSSAENALNGRSRRGSDFRQQSSYGAQAYGHSTVLPAHSSSSTLSNGQEYIRLPPFEPSASRCSDTPVNPTSNLPAHKTDNFEG